MTPGLKREQSAAGRGVQARPSLRTGQRDSAGPRVCVQARSNPSPAPSAPVQALKDRRGRSPGSLLAVQTQRTQSHFYFLFIICTRTPGNGWRRSFSPLTSKPSEGTDEGARGGGARCAQHKRERPAYGWPRLAPASDIAPPGAEGARAARTVI